MTIQGDALAKAVRARMKKIGLHPYKKVKCVYSTEQAAAILNPQISNTPPVKGSLMQVTAVFGCTLASMLIKDIQRNSTSNK
jgi:tRNA A37 threonylcarbamoyladenosine dehydratase